MAAGLLLLASHSLFAIVPHRLFVAVSALCSDHGAGRAAGAVAELRNGVLSAIRLGRPPPAS
jgi:hypothetical protein